MYSRYGWAIRTGGDVEIAGAIARGMLEGRKETPHPALCATFPSRGRLLEGEDPAAGLTDLQRRVEADLRNLAFRRHTPEEIETMIIRARYEYGQAPEPSRLARRLLRAWAAVWCLIWSCRGWRP